MQPNFVIVHCDQLRYDCIGLTRKRQGLFLPHIDDMAAGGMEFSAAYSTCPICIPQRMTLMSGQLAKTHGVLKNVGIPHYPFEHTLPGELARGGYQTAHVGRTMHLYPEDAPARCPASSAKAFHWTWRRTSSISARRRDGAHRPV